MGILSSIRGNIQDNAERFRKHEQSQRGQLSNEPNVLTNKGSKPDPKGGGSISNAKPDESSVSQAEPESSISQAEPESSISQGPSGSISNAPPASKPDEVTLSNEKPDSKSEEAASELGARFAKAFWN